MFVIRITGLGSGLDVDNMVKETMKAYRIKIDQVQQKKEIVEIKQKLYRETIKEVRTFYEKYFDPANKDSILLSKNFKDIYAGNASGNSGVNAVDAVISDNEKVVFASGKSDTNSSYKVEVTQVAKAAEVVLDSSKYSGAYFIEFNYGGVEKAVRVNDISDGNAMVTELNTQIEEMGLKAQFNGTTGEITVQTMKVGAKDTEPKNFTVTVKGFIDQTTYNSTDAENAIVKITSSSGKVDEYVGATSLDGNVVNFEGVTFELKGIGTAIVKKSSTSSSTTNNSTNSVNLEDRITEVIKDYNKLIESLNTRLATRYDRSYQPLTSDQKEEMSESEIKLWNEKVEAGQLWRDAYVEKIARELKSAMGTVVSSTGLKLSDIGITMNAEYGVKNGTYTIDTDKLSNALEYNFEDVKQLFIGITPTDEAMSSQDKFFKSGIFTRMKNSIYAECYNSSSAFLKQVGYEGTTTQYENRLSKDVIEYQNKITNMEELFSKKEETLYSQYARLESALASLTSQQNYLSQMMGTSSK